MTARIALSLCALTFVLGCKGAKPDAPLNGNESLRPDGIAGNRGQNRCLVELGAALTDADVPALQAAASRIQAINGAVKTRFASATATDICRAR